MGKNFNKAATPTQGWLYPCQQLCKSWTSRDAGQEGADSLDNRTHRLQANHDADNIWGLVFSAPLTRKP